MISQFQSFLTFENIYLCSNFAMLPFWLMLIFIPGYKITRIFTNSIILPLLIAAAYSYTFYQILLMDEPILEIFQIYLSLENLYTIFATESFLLVFWLHFLALNLFLGSWVSIDGVKYNMPKKIVFAPLILIFFSGPVGLVLHWMIRIFYAKKIGFHD
tara:strand:- start:649 stop:1122 length:474 start_codon:yes stop_codon:yes gene_type:complete